MKTTRVQGKTDQLQDDLAKTKAGAAARGDGKTGRQTRQMEVRKDKMVQRRRGT